MIHVNHIYMYMLLYIYFITIILLQTISLTDTCTCTFNNTYFYKEVKIDVKIYEKNFPITFSSKSEIKK